MPQNRAAAILASPTAPTGVSLPALALWHAAHDGWDEAHGIVQSLEDVGDRDAAWVHAHLHRVEGDISNAGYWYRQARRPMSSAALEAERAAILAELLRQDG